MNMAVPEEKAEMRDMTRFSEIGIVSPISQRESIGTIEFMNNEG